MRLKRAHALAPIKHLSYPRRFVFFDTESTVRNWGLVGAVKPHVPRLIEAEAWEGDGEGGGYSLREEREFLNEEDTDESNAVPFKARSDAICAAFWAWLDGLASGSSADRASVAGVNARGPEYAVYSGMRNPRRVRLKIRNSASTTAATSTIMNTR